MDEAGLFGAGEITIEGTLPRATLLPPDVTPKCLISSKLENDSRETRKRQCQVRKFRQEIIHRESRNGIAAIQRAHPDSTTGAPNSSSARRTRVARSCRSGDRRSDCPAFAAVVVVSRCARWNQARRLTTWPDAVRAEVSTSWNG